MAKDFLKSDPIGDLEAQLNSDFNTVIKKAHKSLGTKTYSPVYTGFFASSWKVANTPPKAKDDVYKFKPWADLAREGKKKPPRPKFNLDLKLKEHLILKKVFLLEIQLNMLLML